MCLCVCVWGGEYKPLTSCLTSLDQSVFKIKTIIVSSHAADSKRLKQEVNGTVILHPLVFPGGWVGGCVCELLFLFVRESLVKGRMSRVDQIVLTNSD